MKIDVAALPEDPAILQEMVRVLMAEVERLNHRLAASLRARFGKSSEKMDAHQLRLFVDEVRSALAEPPPAENPPPPKAPPQGHGRAPLPAHLPRKRQEHAIPEKDRVCPECAGTLEKIGEEVSSQLDYVPASFFVREQVRVKYACRACQAHVVCAALPAQPIEKGLPGPGLLAHVITSKYADHLPLYRLEGIFERHGLELSRSTLSGWMGSAAEALGPVVEGMKGEVVQSRKIHTDDTPVPVQDRTHPAGIRQGRLWVYVGDGAHPHTVYDYTPDRRQEHALKFLDGFAGWLQADAYAGYDALYARGVTEVGCWAHARRKFFDARDTDPPRAGAAMAWIQLLYAVEKAAHDLSPPERRALRESRARPILDGLRKWLDLQAGAVLPKSPMGEAVGYALNQWAALTRYLDDGNLAIDNNEAERALRDIALGRKNWLFAGSDEGGRRSAILFSLVASCKRHGLDPYAYFADVLARIATHPAKKLAELFPAHWKPATPAQAPA